MERIALNPDGAGRERDRDTIEVHTERQKGKCKRDTTHIAKERGKLPFEESDRGVWDSPGLAKQD